MVKWEYAEIEVTLGGAFSGTQSTQTIFRANDKPEKKDGKADVLMAQMGEEGWDLVTAIARIEAGLAALHKINYIFKRPKE